MILKFCSRLNRESVVFRGWQILLLLLAGLLLFVGCTTGDSSNNGNSPGVTEAPAPLNGGPTLTPAPEKQLSGTGDGTPEPQDKPIIPDTPTPEPVQLLPANTLGLVMAVSGGSSTGTLKTVVTAPGTNTMTGTAFIELETSSKSVVLFRPDNGEATVINSYTSPSYSPHFKRPYTIQDRLFVSDKYTGGGAMSISEYDTDDFSRVAEWGTQSDAIDPGYAVAGGQVYFKTGSTEQWSMSRGFYNVAGDYLRSSFSSRSDTNEMTRPELGFALVSGGDTLYGARLPSESNPITGVFLVDPNTGQGAENYITAFEIEDWDTYHPSSWRNVVISDGIAYWVGIVDAASGYKMEILAASIVNPDDFTVYEFDMPSSNLEVTGFNSTIDADNGYVLIKPFYEGGDRSKVLIYDTAKETAEVIDTGFHIVDAQLLFVAE